MSESSYVTQGEFVATVDRLDAENSRQNARLDDHEAQLKELTKIAFNQESMRIQLGGVQNSIDALSNDLKQMKEKPLRDAEADKRQFRNTVISTLVSGLFAALVAFAGALWAFIQFAPH